MALSRHIEHLRVDPSLLGKLPCPEKVPETNNKFELRRDRAKIKIPKRLSGIIAQDKKLLKPFSIYFELKPLYYSSVIKNARHHYQDLCEYLDISINNLRQKISEMIRLDLAWWDGKDLRLVAYSKICKRYELSRYYHRMHNIGNTELNLRAVAMKENFEDQTYVSTKKIVQDELRQVYAESQIRQISNVASIPEMVKRKEFASISGTPVEKLFKASALRREKRIIRLRMDVLTKKAEERTISNLLDARKCAFTPNPEITLSCQGVAHLYGCKTPSSGHYWEQQLAAMQMLQISGSVVEIKNHRNPIIWEKTIQGDNNGVFSTTTKKGKKYYFLRLSNSLQLTLNPLFH